jgi:ATP-dependent RNA helicase DeaD
MSFSNLPTFESLDLGEPLLKAVEESGYTQPTEIQLQSIPHLLKGRDILGKAQTGTGKTAAFALPLLSRLDTSKKQPQILVLTPTRELAIQVAESFKTYAKYLTRVDVLAIYGGTSYTHQLRQLKKGTQVIVGTPGRVMDHIRKGTLRLNTLQCLVLDEADEMLRMGFIDDVEWIMDKIPESRQIALFSATMPTVIRRMVKKYLDDPAEILIESKTATAETIRQRFWRVYGLNKQDALSRILELEDHDAMLVFVRTKNATVELAEQLTARGFACEALNGDLPQSSRERIIERLKKGKLDILVATDVAARGLDVERISHVVNYDIPYDSEAYIHRIGRTGRAGRQGDAILFVSKRENRLLRTIEKATKQPIKEMSIPTVSEINKLRIGRFKNNLRNMITEQVSKKDNAVFTQMVNELHEEGVDAVSIASALAHMANSNKPLLLSEAEFKHLKKSKPFADNPAHKDSFRKKRNKSMTDKVQSLKGRPDVQMERYRVEVGYDHGVKPGNIVGAIANEAGLDSGLIGQIEIFDDHSLVDLPSGMPKDVYQDLQRAWVCQQQLKIKQLGAHGTGEKNLKIKKGKGRKTNNRSHQQQRRKVNKV